MARSRIIDNPGPRCARQFPTLLISFSQQDVLATLVEDIGIRKTRQKYCFSALNSANNTLIIQVVARSTLNSSVPHKANGSGALRT